MKIYWDVDDVILNTSEAFIEIINEQYNAPNGKPSKTINDLKDWGMKSIYKDIPDTAIWDISGSEDFWNRVTLKDGFESLFKDETIANAEHVFVTVGTEDNLRQKKEFLENKWKSIIGRQPSFDFIGLPPHSKKECVDMSDGIQIDDNLKYLINTNARAKILIKNFLETDYNSFGEYSIINSEDVYEVHTLGDIKEFLQFALNNPSEF